MSGTPPPSSAATGASTSRTLVAMVGAYCSIDVATTRLERSLSSTCFAIWLSFRGAAPILLPVGRMQEGDHDEIAMSIPFDLFSGWKVSRRDKRSYPPSRHGASIAHPPAHDSLSWSPQKALHITSRSASAPGAHRAYPSSIQSDEYA